jgi:GTP-binding protein HflX
MVVSKDMLFQTLESTLREVMLPSGSKALLQDTVGFISDLPHGLFASFKSCLDDIHTADVVIHLVDISNPFWEE